MEYVKKKKNFKKGFNTLLENGFCLSQGECSQLLHMMGLSERPQELWGTIRVELNAGTKSLPARTHPDGKCTVLKSGILQELGQSAVRCWWWPSPCQHPPALSLSHRTSLEMLPRQRGGFHNISPGVFGFTV